MKLVADQIRLTRQTFSAKETPIVTSNDQAGDNSVEEAYKLNVLGLFQSDADRILSARERSQHVHKGGNIRSAGDEVEAEVRSYYKRRLPTDYTVHHGHFLDSSLNLSPQMDIIIADNGRFPTFFRGQEGMEYLPFEGVYAFGEIKSSLTNSHVRDFIKTSNKIRSTLKREKVPDGYIERFEESDQGELVWQPSPERGDLYRFIFGVTSDGLNVDQCLRTLCDSAPEDAPNLICLLDKGVLMAGRAVSPNGEVTVTYLHPQKERAPRQAHEWDGWLLAEPSSAFNNGTTLFYAYSQLIEHLKNNVLLQTNYIDYVKKIVRLKTTFVHRKDTPPDLNSST
jgi:hypothetical protein